MNLDELKNRIDEIISLADRTVASERKDAGSYISYVNSELFAQWKTASLSFILNLFGKSHPYFYGFENSVRVNYPSDAQTGRGILKSIKDEIDGGWLFTIKGIVSSEIFFDFLEMATYLLDEKYKDPAAVMIGSVLEEHLRQLCLKNNIATENIREEKSIPKKADQLNADLASANVYNKLDQKNATAWLDLRNKAAHGKYGDYTQQQVENMLQAVTEFMSRNAI